MRRTWRYVNAMFPLHVHLPLVVVVFASFWIVTAAVRGEPVRPTVEWWWGMATMALGMLLLRVFDDLKDETVDPQVFPNRPLVAGLVRYADVRWLGLALVVILVAFNLGRGPATDAFLAYFAVAVLSWQWWFFPDVLPQRPVLVLLTHQPLAPLAFIYVYGTYAHVTGGTPAWGQAVALAVAYWPPLFAWEIARKVRAPEQEDAYLSYTRRWGTRRAPAVVLVGLLAGGVGMSLVGVAVGWPLALFLWYFALVLAAGAVVLRFIARPSAATNRVRLAVESFAFLYYLAPIVHWLMSRG